MSARRVRLVVAAPLSLLLAGCAGAPAPATAPAPSAPLPPTAPIAATPASIARAAADSARLPWTAADAAFMREMIAHHGQALVMAAMVPERTTNEAIRTLAARIINAQRDEIALMQRWLADRRQPVPDPAAPMAGHAAHGDHAAAMPGMLSAAELAELAAARGGAFDRLFLRRMIQHHEGAVTMVTALLATDGAAQEPSVFRLASDVQVDQRTEIARMQRMLAALLFAEAERQGAASDSPRP